MNSMEFYLKLGYLQIIIVGLFISLNTINLII